MQALRAQERPERARLMHHAVEAGDVETILAVGPSAAREAALAGSHRQALAHFESVLPHVRRLGVRERAQVLDAYGWELYNAHRFREAVAAGPRGGARCSSRSTIPWRSGSASCASRGTCSWPARRTRPSTAPSGR